MLYRMAVPAEQTTTLELLNRREPYQHQRYEVSTPDISPPTTTTASDSKSLPLSRQILLTLVLANASFVNTALAQICVIELPQISKHFSIPPGRQQWILTSTSLAASCTLLLCGRLADVYGKRRLFRAGMVGMALSCLCTPFAPNEVAFDVFRAVQGLSGACALPTAVGIIFAALPGEGEGSKAQVYAISCFSAGFPMGNAVGCVLGGVIGQYLSWRWAFWVMAVETAVGTVLAFTVIPEDARESSPSEVNGRRKIGKHLDWLGLPLIMACLVCLLLALSQGNVVGWTTPWIPTLIATSLLVLMPGFLYRQKYLASHGRESEVLVKTSLFRNRVFSTAQIVCFIFWACFNVFLVFATYLYQDYQGLNEIQTTLRFLPSGVTGVVTVWCTSQLLSRVNGNIITGVGMLLIGIASLLFAAPLPTDTTYWAYGFPAMVLLTLGGDSLYPCLTFLAMRSIPKEEQGIGAALFQTLGQVGRSLGIAIATAVSTGVAKAQSPLGEHQAQLHGYRAANWLNFGLSVSAAVLAACVFRSSSTVPGR